RRPGCAGRAGTLGSLRSGRRAAPPASVWRRSVGGGSAGELAGPDASARGGVVRARGLPAGDLGGEVRVSGNRNGPRGKRPRAVAAAVLPDRSGSQPRFRRARIPGRPQPAAGGRSPGKRVQPEGEVEGGSGRP